MQLSYANFTALQTDSERSSTMQAIRIAMYIIIMIVSLAGNLLVILVITFNRFMHKPTNYFILNLALCDLAILVSCMWVQIVTSVDKNWLLGELFCKVNSYMQMVSVVASVLTLTAVSCDRFIGIMYPFRRLLTSKKSIYCISMIWSVSGLVALPIFFYRTYTERHWSDFVQRQCDDTGWPKSFAKDEQGCVVKVTRPAKRAYYTGVIFFLFFLPIVVISLTCTIMIRKLSQEESIGESYPHLMIQQKKKKVFKESMLIIYYKFPQIVQFM